VGPVGESGGLSAGKGGECGKAEISKVVACVHVD
jgi:hypothetical protein